MKSQGSMQGVRVKCRHWPFWIVIILLGGVLGLSLLLNLTAIGLLTGPGKPSRVQKGEDE